MKRILFYGLLVGQIIVIALIGWQDQLIDRYGKEIQLRAQQEHSGEYGWMTYNSHLSITTEIDFIPSDKWDVDAEELSFNDLVYVLLEEDKEGFYIVKKASTKRLKPKDQQVLLVGKFMGHHTHGDEVDYQWELIPRRKHEHINHMRPYFITVKVAPWRQWKITKLIQE